MTTTTNEVDELRLTTSSASREGERLARGCD